MTESIKEERYRIKCEKVVNESWSVVEEHKDEIKEILEKGGPETDRELSILKIAAEAFLMKISLSRAEDIALFGVNLEIPCGKKISSCDDCDDFTTCEHT